MSPETFTQKKNITSANFLLLISLTPQEEEWIALAALTNITSCLISGDNDSYIFLGFVWMFDKKNVGYIVHGLRGGSAALRPLQNLLLHLWLPSGALSGS